MGNAHETPSRDYAAVSYAILVLSLPFLADSGISGGLFFALWLGGSFAIGAFVPIRRIAIVIGLALLVLLVVLFSAAVETEFFSDALSSVALLVLAAGEMLAALGGAKLGAWLGGRADRVGP